MTGDRETWNTEKLRQGGVGVMTCCPTCGQQFAPSDDLVIDEDSGILVRHGHMAKLTRQQFEMFRALRDAGGRVMKQEQLFAALYWQRNDAEEPKIKIIDVLICKVRPKLAPLGIEIQTVWGNGYRLVSPVAAKEKA